MRVLKPFSTYISPWCLPSHADRTFRRVIADNGNARLSKNYPAFTITEQQRSLTSQTVQLTAVVSQGNRSRFVSSGGRSGFVFASIESAPLGGRIIYVLRSDARLVRATGMRDQDESLKRAIY